MRTEPAIEKSPAAQGDAYSLAARGVDTRGRSMREHAARGFLINTGFQIGLAGVTFMRRLLVAAFLTQAEYGLWGILIATLVTLSWLKQLGIADKYIQQTGEDQELAYQRAFTLELAVSLVFFLVVVAAMPVYALAYGSSELILPGIVLATIVPISALQTPIWIAQRRMQFVRQRSLMAVDPLVAFAFTLLLAVLGFGYWALVVGAVSGAGAGAMVALATSPYRPRLSWSRTTLAEYASFSWPLLGFGVSNLIAVQGTLLVANSSVGLAGVGAIGLAAAIASFADRVDRIVSQTIYPAVCAVADKAELLREAFIKSNRLTLMWAIPFGVALALFAGDLITFVLGERWRPAEELLMGVGLISGLGQVAFNWSIFMRAVNNTKPIFIGSLANLALFFVVMVPAILMLGLNGYLVGLGVTVAAQIILRGYFLGQLFGGFKVLRHLLRAIAPSLPAAAIILGVRLLTDYDRSLPLALGEVVLYVSATVAFTLAFERGLVREVVGYVFGSTTRPALVR